MRAVDQDRDIREVARQGNATRDARVSSEQGRAREWRAGECEEGCGGDQLLLIPLPNIPLPTIPLPHIPGIERKGPAAAVVARLRRLGQRPSLSRTIQARPRRCLARIIHLGRSSSSVVTWKGGYRRTLDLRPVASNGGRNNFPVSAGTDGMPGASPVHIAGSEATLRGSLAYVTTLLASVGRCSRR